MVIFDRYSFKKRSYKSEKVREEREIIMTFDEKIIEEITSKAVKKAIAEMEQAEDKTVETSIGQITLTSAEMDEDSSMNLYINISEVSDTWKEIIDKAIETGKLAHEESKRYGWTWSNAGVDTLTRLYVTIKSDWKVKTGLEVYFQDKEKDYLFGTVYFHVNIADDAALKEIIVASIREKLFQ